MGKDIDVQNIMVVLDLAMYAKAVEVLWQKQEELNRVVIRLGAFQFVHLSLSLGNDSNVQGLKISLIESEVVVFWVMAIYLSSRVPTSFSQCLVLPPLQLRCQKDQPGHRCFDS